MSWEKYLPGNGYWTGRSGLYKDQARVDYVKQELSSINSGAVTTARKDVSDAIVKINNTLSGIGIGIPDGAMDGTFDAIEDMIGTGEGGLISLINAKVNEIDEYAKQSSEHPFKTAFATGGMMLSKFGEGFTSAFEDIGDGALTLTAGWGSKAIDAIAGTNLNEGVSNFISRDLSNEAFSAINDATGISKYSYIKSDSGLANLSKAGGVATGYLTMSAWAGGYGSAKFAKSTNKVLKAAGTFAKSSTNVNTVMAALGGYGSGTENSLQQGNDFVRAATIDGGKQALIQGGTAYAMGKLGEKISEAKANKQLESARADMKSSADELNSLEKELKDIKSGKRLASSESDVSISETLDDIYEKGRIAKAKNDYAVAQYDQAQATLDNIQGYNDPISVKARQQGQNLANNGIKETAKNVFKAAKTNVRDGIAHPIKTTVKVATSPVVEPLKLAKNGVKLATEGMTKGGGATNAMIAARSTIGGVAAYHKTDSDSRATEQFKINQNSPAIQNVKNSEFKKQDDPVPTDTTPTIPDDTSKDTTSKNPKGQDDGKQQRGSTGGGGGSSQPYTPDTGTASDQFRENKPDDTIKPADDKKPEGTTTPTSPTTPEDQTPSTPTTPEDQTPSTPDATGIADTPSIVVPEPSDNGTYHTGGGYSASTGFVADNATETANTDLTNGLAETEDGLSSILGDGTSSIDDVIKGSRYTKIPTSTKPITTTTSSSGANAVIPIAAGLSAAAAAGIGAKAYMDRRKNNDNGEDDDEFDTDEWTGDDSVDIQYDDSSDTQTLDSDDDYSYKASSNDDFNYSEENRYDARTSDELADIQ